MFPCRTFFFLALLCIVQALPARAQSAKKHSTGKPTPAAASPTPAASPVSTYNVPDPVADVDGDPIHRDELERVVNALLASSGKTTQGLGDDEKKRVYHTVLDEMITDKLVNRLTANETVKPMDVEKRLNELISHYPSQEAFESDVKKSGQSMDQVRQNVRNEIAQQQWVEEQIADKIKVTPGEVEKFYKEGPPSKFDAPEMVRASHILVAVRRDAPPEEALAAEQKINALAARIKKGESFEAVAKSDSDDPKAKVNGGDLDYFSRERIMPEFADAAFKLKVGEVSAPVRTQFGYHLIKLTDRKPAHTAALDEARGQIQTYLQDEKRRTAVASLVMSLRDNAKIETFLP